MNFSASARPRTKDELPSVWRSYRALQQRMDDGIAAAYEALAITGVSTRFSMALMFLQDGPATIRDLAVRCGVTHSAMSQSVQAMRRDGLVSSKAGDDARSRLISLTDRGREIAPVLWDEWYATEAVIAELEAETGVSIEQYAAAMNAALDRRSFADRLRGRLER